MLLKRRADEKHYPNVYEMPGGKVNPADATIRDAVIREVAEETSLAVKDVLHPLQIITYTTQKPAVSITVKAIRFVGAQMATQLSVASRTDQGKS
jgi:8-oxo-dGTP pyrophosphatase MutT (NUDIX family)